MAKNFFSVVSGTPSVDRRMKPAPYTGPEPTIAQMLKQHGWVWAYCDLHCGHYAAIPLARVIDRLGAQSPADALRKRLRCTKCGRRGVTIRCPSIDREGYAPLPIDKVPSALRVAARMPHMERRGCPSRV
jgi:hypothetical protein